MNKKKQTIAKIIALILIAAMVRYIFDLVCIIPVLKISGRAGSRVRPGYSAAG